MNLLPIWERREQEPWGSPLHRVRAIHPWETWPRARGPEAEGAGRGACPPVRGGICVAGAEANRRPLRVGRWIERERNKWSLIKRGRAAEGRQTALPTSLQAGLRTAAPPTVGTRFAQIAFEFGVHPRRSKLMSRGAQ